MIRLEIAAKDKFISILVSAVLLHTIGSVAATAAKQTIENKCFANSATYLYFQFQHLIRDARHMSKLQGHCCYSPCV
jgi:hypothetical protein